MTNKFSTLLSRAKDIHQQEGLVTLLKRTFAFLLSWLLHEKCTFYLYKDTLEPKNEADFMPKFQDVTFKIVEMKQQLDELSNDGFDLSLLDISEAHYRLEKGAILSLVFIERELAYRGWLALTEEAKNTFNRYPYKVDFSNNEACVGDAWTNPKYRRQGIYTYGSYKRREYLMRRGIKKIQMIVLKDNIIGIRAQNKLSGHNYTEARYLRIGRLQFWKETPVNSIEIKNDEQIEYQV